MDANNGLSLHDLKQRLDIHDVAARLGLQRPDKNGNYRSPHHPDAHPSLQIGGAKYPDGWYDYSRSLGGDVIDLVKDVLSLDTAEAIRWLKNEYGLMDAPKAAPPREKTLAEYIAQQALGNPTPAVAYLTSRGIDEAVVTAAIKIGSVGYHDWRSPSKAEGSVGHGGPATAFIVKPTGGPVAAVDLRYHEPALNGGEKTKSHGDKSGVPWMMDAAAVRKAHTVLIVESAINALSAETLFQKAAFLKGWAAVATRGTGNTLTIDWRAWRGKRFVIGMDNDPPDRNGQSPGLEAAWALYDHLTGLGMATHLLDQHDWAVGTDLNDLMKGDHGQAARALTRFEPWAIPGVPGDGKKGRSRIRLPSSDWAAYYLFRLRENFTSVAEISEDAEGQEQIKLREVVGFRIASIAKVRIAGYDSVLSGGDDHQPSELFAVSAQTSYHGNELVRHVAAYEKLHQPDWWTRFGPVFKKDPLLRLINLWGHASHLGKRDAVNFVGLCWKGGRLRVNEGTDCYFRDPEKQCPYHNLTFPSGPIASAAIVLRAYAQTLSHHAALRLLVWALGAHLKAVFSFWPHLVLQARKGSGKSTVLERLSRTIAFSMFSGQTLQTEFRIVTSVSATFHPVGWEELSARRVEVIDKAVSILQEAYKSTRTKRGAELLEYVLCAPVLLAGEDVPVRSLLGKVVMVQIQDKGPRLPADLPVFPVREWLLYLSRLSPPDVLKLHQNAEAYCRKHCRATANDDGAQRMVTNYAAVLAAWKLLLDFAGLNEAEFNLVPSLLTEMNNHIAETCADREPWVWIMELVINEIEAKAYPFPWRLDVLESGEEVLILRTSHVMHHISTKAGLKPIFDGLPVKSDRVFKKQLKDNGIVVADRVDPIIGDRRYGHMVALSLSKLAEYGLHLSPQG